MEPELSLGTGLASTSHIQVPSRKTAEGIEQPSQLPAVPLLPQDKAEMPAPLQGIPSAAPYPCKGRLWGMSSCSLGHGWVPGHGPTSAGNPHSSDETLEIQPIFSLSQNLLAKFSLGVATAERHNSRQVHSRLQQ